MLETLMMQSNAVEYKGYEICLGSVYKDGEPLFHYYVPLGERDGGVEQGKRIIDQMGPERSTGVSGSMSLSS
ncbi:hypothetical protein [Pseudoduganella buxea]|uniref:Uncharacterized protein n=1 Tax=Pseudoduganella buxea TaxID=1949069 RepID=A0A6I3T5Z7_9BURK|nr:hypothetical protein [Pseudoduganella buxea]MTV56186.1 hypothetical protein [Pseudoduganella buxea]GGC02083.1 hypothetical protein GCM10011572_25020 [Pseudoduganella buxea]